MKISSITPRYTSPSAKSFGASPSQTATCSDSQVMPPYITQNSIDVIRKFYDSTNKDTSWLRDKPVTFNGVKFSLINGPSDYLPKAIKAFYPDGAEIAACKYYDSKNGEVIRYSLRKNANSPYEQGYITDLSSNALVCQESYPGAYLSPSLSEDRVKDADEYLSKFYSDALEAYKIFKE